MRPAKHQAQVEVFIIGSKIQRINKGRMRIAYFYHVLLIIGNFPLTIGIKVFVHPRNGSVLRRPGINFLLCIENTHHPEAGEHTNGPSYSGHIVSTVHTSMPNGICITLDSQHLISVKGDIKIASEIDLVEAGLVVQGQFNSSVLYLAYIGNGACKS